MSLAGLFMIVATSFSAQGAESPAVPTTPAALQPTSSWRVDYGEGQCVALRSYGSGDAEVTLVFQRTAIPGFLNIGIAGRSIRAQPANPQFGIALGQGNAVERIAGRAVAAPSDQRLLFVRWPLDNGAARLRAAQTLRFEPERGAAYYLRLTNMPGVLDQLGHCYLTLLQSLGVDLAAIQALRSLPVPIEPENWISSNLVPGFTGEAEGAALLTISAEGRVTACRTLDTSGMRQIDENICRQMVARARFTPAIGSDGAPVATQFVQRVNYQTSR